MKLLADLHTHSKYSSLFHGKNTIEQMAITANEMGLVEIAITDHGFNHWCGTSLYKLAKARMEVDEINKWSKTKVLLGVEADIIAEDGTLDIDADTLQLIDILVIGYHRLIKTNFANYFGGQKNTKEAREKATNAFLNAIEKYPVTIVSHLDSILTTDLYRIGKACADKGVMVEINNRHCKWNEKQINDLLASGCMFVVSSDAHRREDIGNVQNAFKIVKKYDIPRELIANVEFDEIEKTEDDVEVEQYYSLYLARQKAKEEQQAALEEKKKTQFTNSLSDEMEMKLREIAKEKGLHYEEKTSEDELFETYQKYKATFSETEDLIQQAKEYLNEHTLQEFDTQNTKVEAGDEFIVDSDNDKSNETNFLKTHDSAELELNKTLDNLVETESVSEIQSQSVQQTDDEKVLGIMQKADIPAPRPRSTTANKGAVVVKNNAPVAKTVKSSNQNGRSLESFMQSLKEDSSKPEPKQEEQKQSNEPKLAAKKGRGGVFIQIDGIGDDKK